MKNLKQKSISEKKTNKCFQIILMWAFKKKIKLSGFKTLLLFSQINFELSIQTKVQQVNFE